MNKFIILSNIYIMTNYKPQTILEELLLKYPDKPWNWNSISRNPNITMEMIEENPDKPWNWIYISFNPNITMEFIENNIDEINFKYLSTNKFGWNHNIIKQYWEQRKQKVFEKNEMIKEELIACTWHPDRLFQWCLDCEELNEIKNNWK